MKRNVIALTLLSAGALAGTALALDQTIDIEAQMRTGLTFSSVVNMDFTPGAAHIDFYGSPTPGTDYVTLATDGTIAAATSLFVPTNSTGTPASLIINGDGSSHVDISCSTTATLAVSGTANTMTVDQLELAMNTGTTFQGGSTYACAGLGTTPLDYTLTGGTNTLYMGGRLDGTPTPTTNIYGAMQTGGTPATIRVTYQ